MTLAPGVRFSPIVGGYLVLGLVGAAAVVWFMNGGARTLARSAAALPGNVAAGVVEGVGASVGVPQTDLSQCDADLAAGRMWSASFSCPAGKFIGAVFGSPGDEAAKPIPKTDTSGVDTSGMSSGASGSWFN